MRTSTKALFFSTILVLFVAFSCSKNDPADELTKDGPFNISELAGSWEATQAQFSVSSLSVDIVEDGGTVSMTVQSNGRFSLTLNPIDRAAYMVGGEMFWEKWEGSYYFAIVWDDEPGDWDTYGHTWDGTTFTINGGTDSGEYDFDNDGDAEPCTLHFDFIRI
jgi:hypothetical protein